MQETAQHKFNAPIPGESLTTELGGRPWQKPSQYSDINEVVNYYTTRMNTEEFSMQLADVMDMGIPLTTLANSIQMSGVMQGKHTIDAGILVMPVLMEQMMVIGDALGIKYDSGLEDDAKLMSERDSLAHRSLRKLRSQEDKGLPNLEEVQGVSLSSKPQANETVANEQEEKPMGLMSRRAE